MPTYHSATTDVTGLQSFCGAAALPLKTKIKGVAPPCPEDTKDVIEEAIEFFRANILFRSYEPQGAGDLLVCYLTIYFSEILRFLHKSAKTVADARKSITQISHAQNFGVPGESTFCLSGFFAAPASRTEGELARNYLLQLRQEAALRFVEAVYNPDGTQNKWWFQFNRRKFMNIDHA